MNFAIEYNQYTQHKGVTKELLEKIDEIIITWDPKDVTLYEFLQLYKNKKIIINILSIKDYEEYKLFEKLIKIKEENQEINIVLNFSYNFLKQENQLEKIIEQFRNSKLNYMFQEIAIDWETFNAYIKLGISEIRIGSDLCFNLKKCSELAIKNNISLKTDIGVVQKRYDNLIPDYQSFFIRPDDIEEYSKYIDTFIIYINNNIQSFNILYEIFAEDKTWFGDLKEIITNLEEPIDNRCILSNFAEKRMNCERRCLSGGNCSICKQIFELSKTLNKNDLILEKKEEDVKNG